MAAAQPPGDNPPVGIIEIEEDAGDATVAEGIVGSGAPAVPVSDQPGSAVLSGEGGDIAGTMPPNVPVSTLPIADPNFPMPTTPVGSDDIMEEDNAAPPQATMARRPDPFQLIATARGPLSTLPTSAHSIGRSLARMEAAKRYPLGAVVGDAGPSRAPGHAPSRGAPAGSNTDGPDAARMKTLEAELATVRLQNENMLKE